MKYDAFISYRHAPLDMEIAKKLHKALETYHIPASVRKKTGKKKISRVFRDQEELPIGSDLNDNISSALREAEYLIVICSKDTPESYWVLKEIETFIEMHDREHVLAILIDGEPWNAFPAPLLTDDAGNPVEPLAADIRGASAKERNKKFKSEFLRLAAPVIGCTYDDLKQRHKERIIKRNLAIGFAAVGCLAVFGTAFGIYNAFTASRMKKLAEEKAELAEEKTRLAGEILVELQNKQINQSRFYAEKSASLLKTGKREDAVLVALEALPNETNNRPFVSEAEYALSNALYVYESGERLRFDKMLVSDYQIRKSLLNDDQSRLITIGSGHGVTVFDTESYTRLLSIPTIKNKEGKTLNVIGADADQNYVYVFCDYGIKKYDYEGKESGSISLDNRIQTYETHLSEKKVFVFLPDRVLTIDPDSFKVTNDLENPGEENFYSPVLSSKSGSEIAVTHSSMERDYAALLDLETGTEKELNITGTNVLHYYYTENGNLVVLSANGDFFTTITEREFIDVFSASGEKIWGTELDCTLLPGYPIYNLVDSLSSEEDGEKNTRIVVSVQYETFVFEEASGKLISTFTNPAPVSGMYLYVSAAQSLMGYFSFTNGEITPVNLTDGTFYSQYTIHADFSISDLICKDSGWVFFAEDSSSANIYTLSFINNPYSEPLDILKDSENGGNFVDKSLDGSIVLFRNYKSETPYEFYDQDGKLLFISETDGDHIKDGRFINNTYYMADADGILVVDPVNGKEERTLTYEDFGIMYPGNILLSDDGKYIIHSTLSEFSILDAENKKVIATEKEASQISQILIAAGSDTVFVAHEDHTLSSFRLSDGTTRSMKTELFPDTDKASSVMLSPDGKYLAALCDDGNIRIIKTSDTEFITEIPMDVIQKFHMEFTNNNEVLIIQGDNNKVFIYDIKENKYINSFDLDYSIKNCTFDSEDGLIAIGDGFSTCLISAQDYGLLANVSGAVCFLTSNNTFLTINSKSINRLPYKNYKELISLAKEEFPNASLTEEKKIQYNIN